jgi:hypothetical protein
MATLTTQVMPRAGLAPTYVSAAGGGDKCVTGAGVFLAVRNADTTNKTVTLDYDTTVDGQAVTSRAVVCGSAVAGIAGVTQIPIHDGYKHASDGLAHIAYSAVTSVTVAVIRAPIK